METPLKKERLVNKVLENGSKWWDNFSHDEVKQTFAILRSY
jgi:hypothetical protein